MSSKERKRMAASAEKKKRKLTAAGGHEALGLRTGRLWVALVAVAFVLLFPRARKDRRNDVASAPQRTNGQTFRRIPPTPRLPPSVGSLVAELNDSSPLVREKAAFEIGRMGVEAIEAVGDLKRLAINDPDEEVRRASRIALYNVRGGQPSPEGFFSSTPEP